MGQSTFPIPSSGSSTTTLMPPNATSVLTDGQLTTSSFYSTSVTAVNSSNVILAAAGDGLLYEINGAKFYCPSNSYTFGPVITGTQSVVISPALGSVGAGATLTMPTTNSQGIFYYAAGYWIALSGSFTTSYYSANGTTWTAVTVGTGANGAFAYSAYCNGIFIGFFQPLNYTAYYYQSASSIGTTWSAGTLPASTGTITSGNNIFVASGNTTIYTSSNGTTWTARSLPSTPANGPVVGYGNGYFLAITGFTTGACPMWASRDGITWTALGSNLNATPAGGDGFYYMEYDPVNSTWWMNSSDRSAAVNARIYTTVTPGSYPVNAWANSGIGFNCAYKGLAAGAGSIINTNGTNTVSITGYPGKYLTPTSLSSTTAITSTSLAPNTGKESIAYGIRGFYIANSAGSSATIGYIPVNFANLPISFGIYNGPSTSY